MLKIEFCIPIGFKDSTEVKEIQTLLDKVQLIFPTEIKIIIIEKDQEETLKKKYLWNIAMYKQIKIKQSKRNKALYPQLIVFIDDEAFTFYTQSRPGKTISIKDFLEGILDKEIRCLHDNTILEQYLATRVLSKG